MSSPDGADAADRYRRIVGGLSEAVDELRAHDRERTVALGGELARLEAELRDAVDLAALSRAGVELRWEEADAVLWSAGMRGRTRPEPDSDARPEHLAALNTAVESALEDLRIACRRRLFGR